MAKRRKTENQFAVLGMGRFGQSIVKHLCTYNATVLAVDKDPARLNAVVDHATHAIQADVSDEAALKKLGLGNFDVVILAMGEDFEASLICTMMAKEQGAKRIIVKARGWRQKRILQSIGADEVVLPEYEMGAAIARRLARPDILKVLSEAEHFSLVELAPREEWVGKTLRGADIRRKTGINVLGIQRGDKTILPLSADEVIRPGDLMITLEAKEA